MWVQTVTGPMPTPVPAGPTFLPKFLLGEVTSAQTLILPCPWGSCELSTPASVAVGWFLDPTSVLGMLFWSSLCPSGCGFRPFPYAHTAMLLPTWAWMWGSYLAEDVRKQVPYKQKPT